MEWAETGPEKYGGRRILLAGYRYVGLIEKSDHPDRARFPFTAIELHPKAKGDSDGVLALQSQLSIAKNGRLAFEDFGAPSI